MIIEKIHSNPLIANNDHMRYRPFGKTGYKVSALSFGCMRLSEGQELNTQLLGKAIEHGINYFETTRYYINNTCQHKVAPGIRGKSGGIIVSGKDGVDANKSAFMYRKEIERQLEILGIDHFKFYQVGWFSWGALPHLLKRGGALEAIRKAQDEGLIHHVGFTGHDTPENFIRCIETGLFDSITLPYNLINRQYEPTIKRAGELGVGVVAMDPVGGGVLSGEAQKLKEILGMDMPTTEMALKFVLSNPDISTACSGMNTLEQLEQNVATAKNFDPAQGDLFGKMCAGLDKLRAGLGSKFCTSCRYCMPCPQGIDIPRFMEWHRNWKVFGLTDSVRGMVKSIPNEKGTVWVSSCTQCGKCTKACPNELDIPVRLKELAGLQS